MPFNYHSDGRHGWLEVSKDDILTVGLTLNNFSQFSRHDGAGLFFLEEDCDASLFCKAYEKTHGQTIETRDQHDSTGKHFIRSLARMGSIS